MDLYIINYILCIYSRNFIKILENGLKRYQLPCFTNTSRITHYTTSLTPRLTPRYQPQPTFLLSGPVQQLFSRLLGH